MHMHITFLSFVIPDVVTFFVLFHAGDAMTDSLAYSAAFVVVSCYVSTRSKFLILGAHKLSVILALRGVVSG